MEKYTWDKYNILDSNIEKEAKDIIIGELNDKPFETDPNVFQNHLSPSEYKRAYYKQKVELFQMYPNLLDLTLQLYKYFKADNLIPFNLLMEDDFLNPENIVDITNDLFESINDPEILKIIRNIINPENHYLNFKKKNDNVISNAVHGRTIKIPNQDYGYISMYLGNTLEDITVFAHECGHLLTYILFQDKINPNFNLFSETESYYFEFLMMNYLQKKVNDSDNEVTDLLMSNRLLRTIYYMWDIKIQDLMYHTLGNRISVEKLNKKIHKCKTDIYYTEEDIASSLANPLTTLFPLVNSYLIALELYNLTIKDQEKGIYTYKQLMQDKELDLMSLLKKYNLDYFTNYKSLTELYSKSLKLKK